MRLVHALSVSMFLAVAVPTVLAQELPPFPFEVPEDNGWDDYVQAGEMMQPEDRERISRLSREGTPSLAPDPGVLAEWRQVVEANADVLGLIAKGVAKECVIPPEAAGDAAG